MITIDHAVKTYGDRTVVDDVSLDIPDGSFTILLGPSGSGKSTLLKLINRLIPLTSGSIEIDGRDIMAGPPEILRRGIGYAIQSIGLFPHWTITRNIAAVPQLLGWPTPKISDRVKELLALVRLDPSIGERYPHQLSGGQQQRVGVARALAADPPLLLMDEPFGALDPISRKAIQDEVRRIHAETKKTIVFVTHDLEEALRLGTEIVMLREGKIAQAGSPLDLIAHAADPFIRDFLGAETGLMQLSLQEVSARLTPLQETQSEATQTIVDNASLREALSLMVQNHVDRLAVLNAGGIFLGTLHLADILR